MQRIGSHTSYVTTTEDDGDDRQRLMMNMVPTTIGLLMKTLTLSNIGMMVVSHDDVGEK